MMKSKNRGLFARAFVLALGLFLLLPSVTFAAQWRQDGGWGRNDDQRRERRQERRARRRDRREDRRERRDDRRGDDWDNYDNYGGSSHLRQTALNAGYNNGIKEGRKDSERNERFDYRDEGDYRSATKDYSSRLGDRELYRRYFREGFANGYEDGFRRY